jgi:hypothetical protein
LLQATVETREDMWLVLCDDNDAAARWAWSGLTERGLGSVELVTSQALACASRWVHYVGDEGASGEVTLDDGRTISSLHVQGVLNRLGFLWNDRTASAVAAERDYATQEFYAFCVSWLTCLPGPVVNRPSYGGPGGQWRHDSEWTLLAARAGLPTTPYQDRSERSCPPTSDVSAVAQTVVVLGEQVFGGTPGWHLADACSRLRGLAATDVLGVSFDLDASGAWKFHSATPLPDLRLGGAGLLDALARRLTNCEEDPR